MKQHFLFTLTALLTFTTHAQQKDWQWIKQGGASIEGDEMERIYDIATDSDRNVYVVSPIGIYDLEVDGHPKTFYGSPGSNIGDYVLASFACDGSYRWSKVIGGRGSENAPYIEMDSNDNLYLAGRFGSCTSGQNDPPRPPRIENDIILDPQTPSSCSLLYISKFDQNGNLLWFHRPMPETSSTLAFESYSGNLASDADGNVYWLISIPPGIYANGVFTNTMQGFNWFIFKYGPDGSFLNATYVDIQTSPGITTTSLKMYRNPNNGYFYFTGRVNGTTSIDGQAVTGSFFIACFNTQGDFQWMRQDTYNSGLGSKIYALNFDPQNKIYFGFKYFGFGEDIFLGFSIPEPTIPGLVMKTNSDASNVAWVSYSNKPTAPRGDIELFGNKLAFTSSGKGPDFTWGNQTIFINNDGSIEVLLAFFDKDTGNCTSLDFISGNPGYSDYGTSLATDINGDYLVGGQFEHTLYDTNGNPTTNPNPSNTNFFIAKYATEACEPLAVEDLKETGIKVWPNPAGGKIYISGSTANSYHLHTINGRLVQKGKLAPSDKTIDIKTLTPGVYLLELKGPEGKETVKVVKE